MNHFLHADVTAMEDLAPHLLAESSQGQQCMYVATHLLYSDVLYILYRLMPMIWAEQVAFE